MPRLDSYPFETPEILPGEGTMRESRTGSWRSLRPEIDRGACTKCGVCWKFCPEACVEEEEGGFPSVLLDYCKGCGICAVECPKSCIRMAEEAGA